MSYRKMNPEYKAAWLKALRSGNYTQAVEALYEPDTGSYCCLGVLCEVTPGIVSNNLLNSRRTYNVTAEYSEAPTREQLLREQLFASPRQYGSLGTWEDNFVEVELNPEMMTFFGISAAAQKRLIKMNDDENKTFAEIADWVERNL